MHYAWAWVQERRTKVTKEAVAALDAKATRVYVGNGFFYKRNDFAVTAWHQLSDAEASDGDGGLPCLPCLPEGALAPGHKCLYS